MYKFLVKIKKSSPRFQCYERHLKSDVVEDREKLGKSHVIVGSTK
jgi:hypothetical protein